MIGSIGNSIGSASFSALNLSDNVKAIYGKWSTKIVLATLGDLASDSSGVSPYSLNPAAAMMMDRLQTDLAVESQAVVAPGMPKPKQVKPIRDFRR